MRKTTKLKLNRETIAVLGGRDLRAVRGGMDGSDRDPTCTICENTMPHGGCPGPL